MTELHFALCDGPEHVLWFMDTPESVLKWARDELGACVAWVKV